MKYPEILKQLDDGQISKQRAAEILARDLIPECLGTAIIELRDQRNKWRDDYNAAPAAPARPTMEHSVIIDLIDHALDTDYITKSHAYVYLGDAGMDPDAAIHHIDVLTAIKDRDMERVIYLDDPKNAPRYCTRCGAKVTAQQLSRRSLCIKCSAAAVEENLIGLDTKAGPAYKRWRAAMLKYCYTLESEEIAELKADAPVTLGDLIDHDKLPGCDGECYNCDSIECPYRRDYDDADDNEIPF